MGVGMAVAAGLIVNKLTGGSLGSVLQPASAPQPYGNSPPTTGVLAYFTKDAPATTRTGGGNIAENTVKKKHTY